MHRLEDKPLFGPGAVRPEGTPSIIPDDHYAAIGKVVDAWADLEFEIDQTIWKLLDTHQPLGACITAQLISVLPKLDALRSLVKYIGFAPQIQKMLGKFHGDIGPLVSERNRRVHDKRVIFYTAGKQGCVAAFQVSAKSTLKFGPVAESVEELTALRATIFDRIEEYKSIQRYIYSALPSLHKKLKEQLSRIMRESDLRPAPPNGP